MTILRLSYILFKGLSPRTLHNDVSDSLSWAFRLGFSALKIKPTGLPDLKLNSNSMNRGVQYYPHKLHRCCCAARSVLLLCSHENNVCLQPIRLPLNFWAKNFLRLFFSSSGVAKQVKKRKQLQERS